jgi:type I restriction enzyme S subunit
VPLCSLYKCRFVELFGDAEFNPKQWPLKKLSELCIVGSSKRIYQNEQSTEGTPFLRISDLNARIDNIESAPELFIPVSKYTELKEKGLVPVTGDILVTSRGTLGRCYIVKPKDEFYFQDGMISWLSELNNQITSLYLSHLFTMTGIQKQIASLQAGSTVAYLSISMLKKLDIMLPPVELQNQFAAFVEQVDKSKFVGQMQILYFIYFIVKLLPLTISSIITSENPTFLPSET